MSTAHQTPTFTKTTSNKPPPLSCNDLEEKIDNALKKAKINNRGLGLTPDLFWKAWTL